MESDCHLTVRMTADKLYMNSERVWRITTKDLKMCKISEKIVPRLLNEGQKKYVQVCQDILEQLKTKPNFVKRVVTGNESWILKYNPLIKW